MLGVCQDSWLMVAQTLTPKQKEVLDFITAYYDKEGYSPSLAEIAKKFRRSVPTIHQYIEALKDKGFLTKENFVSRGISPLTKPSATVDLPLIGCIAAGEPIEAISNPEPVKVPKSMLSKAGLHYALKVRGESMIDEGINDEDTVIVRRQETAENGEKIVALINKNQVTLKKIYREKGAFRLQPANPKLKPIFVRDLTIQGKVVGVLKEPKVGNDGESKVIEEIKPTKEKNLLDIGFKRLCNCSPNHINCLTAKEWMKGQVAIWEFSYEKRDIRDKNIHPAVFPIALPKKCIELFTHKGELVLDPFVGIGTTLVAARDLERNAVGIDLGKKYVAYTNGLLSQPSLFPTTKQVAICDDAINIPKYLEGNSIALSVTSPPYANMLNRPRKNKSIRGDLRNNQHFNKVQQYSNNPRDLGTMEPLTYADAIGEIYRRLLPLHKPGAHCVINVTDLWWENARIPVHIYIIESLEKVGYELRNTIIWDRRNLVNKAGIFGWPSNYITLGTTFEYILDFWRPK
jgi:SOS regulatory protein LexA